MSSGVNNLGEQSPDPWGLEFDNGGRLLLRASSKSREESDLVATYFVMG